MFYERKFQILIVNGRKKIRKDLVVVVVVCRDALWIQKFNVIFCCCFFCSFLNNLKPVDGIWFVVLV